MGAAGGGTPGLAAHEVARPILRTEGTHEVGPVSQPETG